MSNMGAKFKEIFPPAQVSSCATLSRINIEYFARGGSGGGGNGIDTSI